MEMQYRLNQERLLNSNTLNQEILVHCIARLNTKINAAYKKCTVIRISYERNTNNGHSSLALHDKHDLEIWQHKYNSLIQKREPLLNTLMKNYHLSLDRVKKLIMQADKEKFPTYKIVDTVIQMIQNSNFRLE